MKPIFLNSKKVSVIIPSKNFSGEMTEIEKISEKIGQYGNIVSYKMYKSAETSNIIFSLKDDYFRFNPTELQVTAGEYDRVDFCDLVVKYNGDVVAYSTISVGKLPSGKLSAKDWDISDLGGLPEYYKSLYYIINDSLDSGENFNEFRTKIKSYFDEYDLNDISIEFKKPGTSAANFKGNDEIDELDEIKSAIDINQLQSVSTVFDPVQNKKMVLDPSKQVENIEGEEYLTITDEFGNPAKIKNRPDLQPVIDK